MSGLSFEWLGGHPTADFVNTLDERLAPTPVERLPSYEALIEFTRQADLIDQDTAQALLTNTYSQQIGEVVWSAALRLREALYRVLYAITTPQLPDPSDIDYIEGEIRRAYAARRLTLDNTSLTWIWQDSHAPERPLWECALAAENLLVSPKMKRMKRCAADDCGVIFVDESKAGARRWCSMAACGNRNKVRQYRSCHT
jgi:predicted RNA-binding Zn ribbon-like protein